MGEVISENIFDFLSPVLFMFKRLKLKGDLFHIRIINLQFSIPLKNKYLIRAKINEL